MKLVVIIIVALLLLGGGGGAAWWFFFSEEPPMDLAELLPPTEEVPLFVDFDPLILPVIRDGQVTHHLTFSILVEVKPEAGRSEVFSQRPRLMDGYFAELHALFGHRIVQDRENVAPLLNKRLLEVSQRILGPDIVTQVHVSISQSRELGSG